MFQDNADRMANNLDPDQTDLVYTTQICLSKS